MTDRQSWAHIAVTHCARLDVLAVVERTRPANPPRTAAVQPSRHECRAVRMLRRVAEAGKQVCKLVLCHK